MPESDSQLPSVRLAPLLGVNQRTAPNSTPVGEWETLEGLYPDQYGELARIPGKTLYTTVAGNPAIFNIVQTNDGSGNVLIQTAQDLRAYTIDELLGRAVAPNIILTPLTDDETMPQAVIIQSEPNAQGGRSLRGWFSGSDTSSADNVWYPRCFTQIPINESGIIVSNQLTPLTGSGNGAGADATTGNWTLAPGTYRIRAEAQCYNGAASLTQGASPPLVFGVNGTFQIGLFNNTAGRFEYHNSTGGTGTAPILSETVRTNSGVPTSYTARFDTTFIVTGGNSTYQLNQVFSASTASVAAVRNVLFGGNTDTITGLVNSAAAPTIYAWVVLNKVA